MENMDGFSFTGKEANKEEKSIDLLAILGAVDTNLLVKAFNNGKYDSFALLHIVNKTKLDKVSVMHLLPLVLAQKFVANYRTEPVIKDINKVDKLIIASDYTNDINEYPVRDGIVVCDRTTMALDKYLASYDRNCGKPSGNLLKNLLLYKRCWYDNDKLLFMLKCRE